MQINPIGVIHSPYKKKTDAPRQGRFSDEEALIEVFPQYVPGLKGIEEVTHLVVLYWGDRADRDVLQTRPPISGILKGVFATRSPSRPNPIAICTVEIINFENNQIRVKGLDALDGSPLIDIKVYSSEIDSYH